MIVREMTKEDLEEVVNIESSLYKDKWNKEAYLRDLENEIAYNYVLEHEGVILGYYGFWLMFDNIDITKVSIRKELQGKGLSKILMEDMFNRISNSDINTITLEVRVSNKVAIALYEKYGFKKISVREKYYENVEDAYVMQKEVN
ncbi:MAG: ribosomal protein S18-alanine N-acetyltransferase [Bacilli bacterium]|nr:ribosomal protein S18-alanine N-acetyltransferase [Bacilli bacterium]